jgi:hypothetical protein
MFIALGQPADIVVALDGDRGPAGEGDALDHVGIERALRQESAPPIFFASSSNTSMKAGR